MGKGAQLFERLPSEARVAATVNLFSKSLGFSLERRCGIQRNVVLAAAVSAEGG
jgi:hypothetical protein